MSALVPLQGLIVMNIIWNNLFLIKYSVFYSVVAWSQDPVIKVKMAQTLIHQAFKKWLLDLRLQSLPILVLQQGLQQVFCYSFTQFNIKEMPV